MKGGRLYLLILFVFLVLVFVYECTAPHKFVWTPTYDKNDKEPFGCFVFDDVAKSSINNYKVADSTFYQIARDSTAPPRSFLLIENYTSFNETDVEYLMKLLERGNKMMICVEDIPYNLGDTLRITTDYDLDGAYSTIENYIKENKNKRDTIFFGTDTLNAECLFEVYPQTHSKSLTKVYSNDKYDDINDTLIHVSSQAINCDSSQLFVWDKDKDTLAIRLSIGKGELYLVSTPLMFANFGILDNSNAAYAFRLLSYLNDLPIVRVEAYGDHSDDAQTPLRYILSEPSLRWAIYSTFVLLLLFMFFSARRRQRIIPVVNMPPNRTFGFMQLISNLYYQRHNNGEILKMKHIYFCAEVKRLIGVDLQETVPDKSTSQRLSEKTGMETETLYALLKNIQMALYQESVTNERLKQIIDGMNDILKALKS